ncbi:hypothetical protein [Cytobacillus firmus]|uniref:hypothetical protein n=1 Tax=Cytobacillus firmus TaxID=1399 RepID=UPI003002B15C
MELFSNLLSLPSFWLLVTGLIGLIIVLKVIRSVIGAVVGLIFTLIGAIRIYSFISDKF